jgi:hypothetical protein
MYLESIEAIERKAREQSPLALGGELRKLSTLDRVQTIGTVACWARHPLVTSSPRQGGRTKTTSIFEKARGIHRGRDDAV